MDEKKSAGIFFYLFYLFSVCCWYIERVFLIAFGHLWVAITAAAVVLTQRCVSLIFFF